MKKTTLKNGIPVIVDSMKGTKVLTALVLFDVGSRYEAPNINGISHFLEHLFFKGTEKRPTTLLLSKELDAVGADFNAFTSKDYTGYYVKMDSKHTDLAIDILEDLLFHPLFDPAEVDRERGVIIDEINMRSDNQMEAAENHVEELMFGAKHPLGQQISGPISNIKSITHKEILDYRSTFYHPKNMLIVLSGDVKPRALTLTKKLFEKAPVKKGVTPKPQKFADKQTSARVQVLSKKTAQSHLALSFPAPKYDSPQGPAMALLSVVLGASMSSRLFINIRERMGLCYYIYSHATGYEDVGAFTIQAGFDTKRISDALMGISRELKDLRDNGVTAEELQQAKDYVEGKLSLRLEDSENVAEWWATQYFRKKNVVSPEEYAKKIQQVTLSQVNAVAKQLFQKKQSNLVVIGPFTKAKGAAFKQQLDF